MRIIDLTRSVSTTFPGEFAKLLNLLHAATHDVTFGTRLDSPSLLFGNGKKINELDSGIFVSQAALLDLTHKKAGRFIDDEDLEAAEEAAGIALRENEFAVLCTGWEEPSGATADESHVSLSKNGAEYLEFKGVIGVGVDAPNLDPSDEPSLPAHAVLLQRGIPILEGLCNLGQIDGTRFRLVALPLKIDASVAPARAIAVLDDAES